ncbi:MAG: hypothetical protein LBH78_01120 [Rickettsiales bacterium]|jgi:hypothetical protein|nr:hypothetical protein [Rickettsiales bacterium]
MNSGTPSLGINVTHNVGNINDAIGFFPKAWRATKKYSVNNTLPIVAVNAWLQFSLAYVAAVVVTSHDMSFITNILNSKAMPAYALASVILGTILLTSLIVRHAHKQEIKDEMLKNGKNTIDREIRGGESDGINEVAQNALTIEIVPDTSLTGNKKENFSIVLPISGKQGEILENKRRENRNKIVLLTVPYVLSGLTVAGALGKFGFANIQSWKQWTFIAAVGVAIVGACVTLSKLGNNEVDNACNTVKRFDNEDILLPFRKGSVLSVMENKFESKEENNLQSQALKLFERFLTGFKNDVYGILDKHLIEANTSFKECLLNPSNANIDKVLTLIRNDIKTLLYNLEESVTKDVNEVKNISGKAITDFFTGIKGELTNKLNQLGPGVIGRLFFTFSTLVRNRSSSEVSGSHSERVSEEVSCGAQDWETQIENLRENLKKELTQELQKHLEELRNKRTQSTNEPNSSSESDLGKQQDKEKKAREKNELLKSQQRTRELEKENTKLEKELSEQEKTDERQEKINGKPSEFLYYVLESIKLGEKDDKEKKVEATLRNLNNKIIIHWKDGSQTICHIKKQGNLQIEPSAAMFTDPSVQAAWEMVRG